MVGLTINRNIFNMNKSSDRIEAIYFSHLLIILLRTYFQDDANLDVNIEHKIHRSYI